MSPIFSQQTGVRLGTGPAPRGPSAARETLSRRTGPRRATGLARPAQRENSPRAPTPTSARAGRALTVLRAHTSRATGRAAAIKPAAHAKRPISLLTPTRTPADA